MSRLMLCWPSCHAVTQSRCHAGCHNKPQLQQLGHYSCSPAAILLSQKPAPCPVHLASMLGLSIYLSASIISLSFIVCILRKYCLIVSAQSSAWIRFRGALLTGIDWLQGLTAGWGFRCVSWKQLICDYHVHCAALAHWIRIIVSRI